MIDYATAVYVLVGIAAGTTAGLLVTRHEVRAANAEAVTMSAAALADVSAAASEAARARMEADRLRAQLELRDATIRSMTRDIADTVQPDIATGRADRIELLGRLYDECAALPPIPQE